jgi:hypothetical protein
LLKYILYIIIKLEYSYENSLDEEYDDEDEKIKRKKLVEEKVPIPKNVVQA